MNTKPVINREDEQRQISTILQALRQPRGTQDQPWPIVHLFGVAGIGKTTLLRQIQQQARALGLPALWGAVQPGEHIDAVASQLLPDLPSPPLSPSPGEEHGSAPHHSPPGLAQLIPGLRLLVHQQGAAVLLLDDVEIGDASQLRWLVALLDALGKQAPLLLVQTAAGPLPWSWQTVLNRPVLPLELGPLDHVSSALLLERHAPTLAPEARALALDWADGYPLALVVLAAALRDGTLDPRQPADRARLREQLTERVLRQGVLGALPPEERPAIETLLRLLAVPRRFTAMLLQDLIEQFAPEWRQGAPFAYFFLPQQLADRTHALRWQSERAGYVVVAPVRHLLQVLWQEEAPARWQEILRWLAAFQERLTEQANGPERIRSLADQLAYRLLGEEPTRRVEQMPSVLASLRQEPQAVSLQVVADLQQDQDLQAALGEQASAWQAALRALQPPPS
ncbi:ATP-binding protein [Thermogemmatispora carboxidivorans]|uniref:ATP-binding protein n=1 Tax=Thermogemmatispora carboxidivorans TaxID=1382306 RepID=UPI00138E0F59|nr:ATP-binding protein [Thermogemmatispora carboxidivorans]